MIVGDGSDPYATDLSAGPRFAEYYRVALAFRLEAGKRPAAVELNAVAAAIGPLRLIRVAEPAR
jgi:hypothetical protein